MSKSFKAVFASIANQISKQITIHPDKIGSDEVFHSQSITIIGTSDIDNGIIEYLFCDCL